MHLFNLFIVRHLARERLRTVTTVLGIALGIGVIIAIQLTNGSSIRAFEAAVESLSGETSLEILGDGLGIDELRVGELGWLRAYGRMSPVIEGELYVRLGPRDGASLRVLGIDILRDRALRTYSMVEGDARRRQPSSQEFLSLLLDPASIVLTERFARRGSIDVGDRLEVTVDDRRETLVVRGLLADEGPAAALDGRIGVMDIAAAQLLFGRLGHLDRLDLRLDESDGIDAAVREIAGRLPPGLRVRRPEAAGVQAEQMLAAFHLNLTALSYIALVVGLFLVYNTVSISVIARRQEIGTLRALGVSRRVVLGLFLGEAAGLAVLGCTLGLLLGRVGADAAVDLTSTAVRVIYVATAAADPRLEPWHVALAFGVGLPLALVAAALPALEASGTSPTAVMRASDRVDVPMRSPTRLLLASLALFVAAAVMATRPAVDGLPLFGYGSALATVLGAALLVPSVLQTMAALGRRWLHRFFHVEGWLANQSLAGGIHRLSISVAALAVSLSLTVAIAVMVSSFRSTVIYWVEQTLQADLFIGPEARMGGNRSARLSADLEALVAAHPDVAAVDQFRRLDMEYGGRLVVLGAGDFDVLLSHGSLLFKAPEDARDAVRSSVGENRVVVSESFSVRFGHQPGDTIELPTPHGLRPFSIAAVYYDYSTDRGVVVMDKRTFARHFGEQAPENLAVYLVEGSDPEDVRESIRASLGEERRVFIRTNAGLRGQILRVFDSTFAITYALEVVAIFVAILGVVGTLLTLIVDRRQEIVMLRLIGGAKRTVRRMVVIEAAMIGVASQVIGVVVGLGLSLILIYVINLQSFGWTLQFRVPWMFLVQSTVLIVATTTLAGVYPAHRAATLGVAGSGGEE